MKVLITGACGFVGGAVIDAARQTGLDWTIFGLDNLIRPGSERNIQALRHKGVKLIHADLRSQSDIDALPPVDWIIDCAANASVLAGADGQTSSRQLMEHNLLGTINMLERCKTVKAGFILLSTSRVYAIRPLAALRVEVRDNAFVPVSCADLPPGLSQAGISETFTTQAPISLYGATKLASETLALEYGQTFNFPVWINRCGVMAGAGQFGRPDQGIFSYWIHSHLRRKPLRYIGFDGHGCQVRDCLHPRDLIPLLTQQMASGPAPTQPRVINVSGGMASAKSLRQLTDWCDTRFGPYPVASDPQPRPFDLPWVVLDSSLAANVWNWTPQTPVEAILDEIAIHATQNPDWLEISSPKT
jgi:CDP-paratose 2-epimerase